LTPSHVAARLAATLTLGLAVACGGNDGSVPAPRVPELREAIDPEVAAAMPERWAAATAELAKGDLYRPFFAPAATEKTFADPWAAMAEAEARGLALVAASRRGLAALPDVLEVMFASLGTAPGAEASPGRAETPPEKRETPPDLAAWADRVEAVLAAAAAAHERTVTGLDAGERAALFETAGALAQDFTHQVTDPARHREALERERSLCGRANRHHDRESRSAALRSLLALLDPDFLGGLEAALRAAGPGTAEAAGVTGPLLFARDTPYGRILFAGDGANTYRLDDPVAFLVDLGGDDHYAGTIASSFDAAHPNAVLVDLGGNDRYAGEPLGLATGRLGVGVLLDRAGDDRYELAEGSGGVGVAGAGLLIDEAGDDVYVGARLTQGAAIAGIGLLWDLAGDDVQTSYGYSLGFGGPAGVGLVLDAAGDDRYQAGGVITSLYNPIEAPDAAPGDPDWQWQAMAIGAGVGRRIVSTDPALVAYALAGGVGMAIDAAGDDRWESDNFSQGCGYYYGQGLKLDAAGRDVHHAARYGQGTGVHYGMGVFLDYGGADTYASSGPIRNAGGAFDHGLALFVDVGVEGDAYDFARSEALGRADFGAVAIAADLGGDDRYATKGRPGRASRSGAAVFYDAEGDDDYAAAGGLPNHAATPDGEGGLVVDR
jgi:hypothetical protein